MYLQNKHLVFVFSSTLAESLGLLFVPLPLLPLLFPLLPLFPLLDV